MPAPAALDTTACADAAAIATIVQRAARSSVGASPSNATVRMRATRAGVPLSAMSAASMLEDAAAKRAARIDREIALVRVPGRRACRRRGFLAASRETLSATLRSEKGGFSRNGSSANAGDVTSPSMLPAFLRAREQRSNTGLARVLASAHRSAADRAGPSTSRVERQRLPRRQPQAPSRPSPPARTAGPRSASDRPRRRTCRASIAKPRTCRRLHVIVTRPITRFASTLVPFIMDVAHAVEHRRRAHRRAGSAAGTAAAARSAACRRRAPRPARRAHAASCVWIVCSTSPRNCDSMTMSCDDHVHARTVELEALR